MYLETCSTVLPLKDPLKREEEYAVITGGNQGIGWFTIKALVKSGMKVIVGCRDGPCKDQLYESIKNAGLPTGSVEWINLDLSSMDCVRAFGKAVLDKNIPISLLINNAGTMSPYALTKDGFETQFAVNYLGHFLLTHLLLPRLIEAGTENKAARIVCLSSIGHAFGWFEIYDLQAKSYFNKLCAYSQSKSAIIMFTKVLHERLSLKNYPVKIYAIHPGIIRSALWTQHWFANIGYLTTKLIAKTEEQGAQRVVHAALSSQVEDLSGNYFENSKAVEPIKLVRNRDTQKKLWEKSCQLLDISQFGGLQ
ncbi:retinol dehydrogenase 12-like isoform X2 [Daphnia pulicaria]|uniref:retinol dehydrogenase 12-like isoform X2 n=1 Tax=Daphnia pulicaria TaxID=35523 RepID=UPI001EEAB825|nr:retinol dehydrogenase 12-like isoform X2 [Daphnia pulicaria]